jgi:L-ornithine Nalpha-acyltransferase
MPSLHWRVATTLRDFDAAARIRYTVFGEELGWLSERTSPARRELTGFDTLDTTSHVLVFADDEPVATLRLLLPNPRVAASVGGALGLELEKSMGLSRIVHPGAVFAESSRFCVLEPWRNSEVVLWLHAGLYLESRRRGVTHLIGSANLETDSREDALLAWQVAAHRGWLSPRWRVDVRDPWEAPDHPRKLFYSPEDRARAERWGVDGLRLPRAPTLFARKLGARFVAEPMFEAAFRCFTLPLIIDLDEVPARTLARIHALDPGANPAHPG